MFHIILIAVVVLVVLLLIIVAMQPVGFRVERSAVMNASPAAIFPYVNELRKWEPWSPWAKMDPNAKNTFAGPAAGVGAVMAWAGNNKVGEGRMTVVESCPAESVRLKLEFFKPMVATSEAQFVFKPQGNQTEVTWSMTGKNNFVAKAFHLFMNCDKMIGGQFSQGLAGIKAIVEGKQA